MQRRVPFCKMRRETWPNIPTENRSLKLSSVTSQNCLVLSAVVFKSPTRTRQNSLVLSASACEQAIRVITSPNLTQPNSAGQFTDHITQFAVVTELVRRVGLSRLMWTQRYRSSTQSSRSTHNFEHVPVEDVVISEALFVEEVAEQLAKVWVVGLVVKTQRTTEVEICRQLGWNTATCSQSITLAVISVPFLQSYYSCWAINFLIVLLTTLIF